MPLRRTFEGLVLLAWLGGQYLLVTKLGRWWVRPAQSWRTRLDRHGARLLSGYVRRHGALLIKIGQFIATRPDIFPLSYVDACASLRDQAPARPWTFMRSALDHAYEGRTAERFTRFEEEPLAAASFGQVHRAWLANGELVAVKIQYPDLGPLVEADLRLTRRALRLFSLLLPGWPLDTIRREIERTAREEQDYLHEGTAADRLRPVLATVGIAVPQVHWEHTRERVLVMEFAPGATLARLTLADLPAAERRRIADTLIDGFLAQLLEAGYFHADPHAGNLIREPREGAPARLWLIDFGMTARLTRRESELYRRFLDRLRDHDTDGMVDVLLEIGFVLPEADRGRLKGLAREIYDQLGHLDPRTFKGSRRQSDLAARIHEFLRRMDGIVFPQHTLMLSRATSLIEGLCMELVPGSNVLDLVRPRLARIGLRSRVTIFLEEVKETWRALRSLPDHLRAAAAPSDSRAAPDRTVLCAVLLLAAIQVPVGTYQTIASCAAIIALLAALVRRR